MSYDQKLQYRICIECKSTHVGPKAMTTTCPYLTVHHVRRTMVPRRV